MDDSHAQRISLPQYERSEGVLSARPSGQNGAAEVGRLHLLIAYEKLDE
jgi:hypothetical protein